MPLLTQLSLFDRIMVWVIAYTIGYVVVVGALGIILAILILFGVV